MSGPPEIALFIGRLHVLLLHLPIGLIALLALMELLARSPRFRHINGSHGLVLALAVPAALFTAGCGWLLSLAGGYDPGLLQWHKWTGLATAAACLAAGILYRLELRKAYRWLLFSTVVALVVASHFGGSLTHGSDYLVRYAPAPLRAWLSGHTGSKPVAPVKTVNFEEQPAFAAAVQPVLQKNCIACHGPDKSKGKLRLDSFEALLKGGGSGPAIVAGKSSASELVKRLHLPPEDEDHMPPKGKPQPGADDIALLEWWIDAGAPAGKKIGELKPPLSVARILRSRFGEAAPVARTVPPKPLKEILPASTRLGDELNIVVTPLSEKDPWLQVNASVAGTNFGDAELAKLAPLAANLRWLDLGGTAISDAGLAHVAAMPNLSRLHLERTHISDAGLGRLAALANLEYLNLYGTPISDTGLEKLRGLPNLKQLYLWQTKVSPGAAGAFADAHTDKAQVERWQQEIEQLQAKVRDSRLDVEFGIALSPAASTNSAPINKECPVSGKPIDPTKTVEYEGKVIAFCCDDCKAKFQQDAKPFLAKLNLAGTNSAPTTGGR